MAFQLEFGFNCLRKKAEYDRNLILHERLEGIFN